MKIFTAAQLKACDQATIQSGTTSIHLMERASSACAGWIKNEFRYISRFYVFCGTGNNGGDGFAIARMLHDDGFDVEVFVDKKNQDFSEDAQVNFKRLKKINSIRIRDFYEVNHLNWDNAAVIDAVFGYGLNRPVEGRIETLINRINQLNVPKIAIDLPSGLFADQIPEDEQSILNADVTLTFQFYKRSFLHPETGAHCGRIVVLDIGLDEKFIQNTDTNYNTIDEGLIHTIYRSRKAFSHKGTYGKSILVGGSYGKAGAVMMATEAALRTGSGLTFTMAPNCANFVLQTRIPEAMFIQSGDQYIDKIMIQDKAVYGIGPGLGKEESTVTALFDFLKNSRHPTVLDADALNILAEHQQLNLIPEFSVITPHPLEFERLFGKTKNSFERLELARQKSAEMQIYIVLKDHHTAVITPAGAVFYNITGNAGLAKGGSGDALTGIITSLMAQQYETENACIFGVWLHGKAGDLAASEKSEEAMLPTDLIANIGNVFHYLKA